MKSNKKIGMVITGSIVQGLTVRINTDALPESIKTGKFVCVIDRMYRFFSLITDLALHIANPDIALFPPSHEEKLLSAMLKKETCTLQQKLSL
jgi:hypothetical protein